MIALIILLLLPIVTACTATPRPGAAAIASTHVEASALPAEVAHPVRLVFLGDVMLGRGVADVAAHDPGSIFERLRPALVDADLALANLESPLTSRPHATSGYALEADPAVARLLATASLDVLSLANNHATDADPATVLDTIAALDAAGVRVVGAGPDMTAAMAPLVVDVGGVLVGILAFDMTGGGIVANGTNPGVNTWDSDDAERAVRAARADVDILVVGVHGGVEYLPRPDPALQQAVDDLAAWGADVVWGHGAHIAYPVKVANGHRQTVLAPGLGNAVFDQERTGTDQGTLLEVIADRAGVVATRTGTIDIDAGRAVFTGWHDPAGDAVAIRGEWWAPVRPLIAASPGDCRAFDLDRVVASLPAGSRVVAASCGAVTGPNTAEMAIAYRRPFTRELLQDAYPGRRWADADGLAAQLAIMTSGARMVWGAATLPDPIGAVAVCSGSIAVGYTTLDEPVLVAAGAWTWRDFGFAIAPALTGPTLIDCADADRDGTTEPYVRRRTVIPGGTAP